MLDKIFNILNIPSLNWITKIIIYYFYFSKFSLLIMVTYLRNREVMSVYKKFKLVQISYNMTFDMNSIFWSSLISTTITERLLPSIKNKNNIFTKNKIHI